MPHLCFYFMDLAHLQVLLVSFHIDGWETLFFSSSQHSPLAFEWCCFPQFCKLVCCCTFFDFLPSFILLLIHFLLELVGFLFSLMRSIISFIALVVLLTNVSIWQEWVSVRVTISSSVASACSSIMFALKCFTVSSFGMFSFAYSAEMNVLMFCQVLFAAVFASHWRHAASNSPAAFQ